MEEENFRLYVESAYDADISDERNLIPIIGDEVIYVLVDDCEKVKIQEYIASEFEKSVEIPQEYRAKIREGLSGLSLMTEMASKSRIRSLKFFIENLLRGKTLILEENVANLLKSAKFPLILTTSLTNTIEKVLEEYGVKYDSKYFKAYQTGLNNNGITPDNNILSSHIVYHIFGKYGEKDLALSENAVLSYLYNLCSMTTMPKDLLDYVKNRYLLSMGCNFPDWCVRFLLYAIKRETLIANDPNLFIGGALQNNFDADLANFLTKINYCCDNSVEKFVKALSEKYQMERKDSKDNAAVKIFVSYYSEDLKDQQSASFIRNLVKKLQNEGFDVFFFEKLNSIEQYGYWETIEKGLHQSRFFIPILTHRIEKKIKLLENPTDTINKDCEPGFITEWKLAMKEYINRKTGGNKNKVYSIPCLFGIDVSDVMSLFADNEPLGVKELFVSAYGISMYKNDEDVLNLLKECLSNE